MSVRLRPAVGVTLGIIVFALGAGALWIWSPWGSASQDAPEAAAPETVTVPVVMGTLTQQLRLNATLGYGAPLELLASTGTITALPAPGQVISAGEPAYEADGRPVTLLSGERPVWRDLARGVDEGKDVLQLEHNLAQLGFFDREPNTEFDGATADAVKRWQKAIGMPVTGAVAMMDVVAVNGPSIRVSPVTATLGQAGVSPLSYTATALHAEAKLTGALARELQVGTPVTVVRPGGTGLENVLASVTPGGQPTGEEGKTTPPIAVIEFADQAQVSAVGPATIRVIVRGDPATAETPEEPAAPMTLIVPATAIVATAQDRYAVEVQTKAGIVRVHVQIGLIADARVQILASGADVEGAPADARSLATGDEVVISR